MLRLLKNADWKPFLDLLSPRFFDVVPMSTVLSQARTLGGNYFDTAAFAAARQARAATLAGAGGSHSTTRGNRHAACCAPGCGAACG